MFSNIREKASAAARGKWETTFFLPDCHCEFANLRLCVSARDRCRSNHSNQIAGGKMLLETVCWVMDNHHFFLNLHCHMDCIGKEILKCDCGSSSTSSAKCNSTQHTVTNQNNYSVPCIVRQDYVWMWVSHHHYLIFFRAASFREVGQSWV